MCYRDRCYCSSEQCITPDCLRRLTDEDRARASLLRLPIAWMDYEKHCERFSAPGTTSDTTTTASTTDSASAGDTQRG